jgi:hypothetical protein
MEFALKQCGAIVIVTLTSCANSQMCAMHRIGTRSSAAHPRSAFAKSVKRKFHFAMNGKCAKFAAVNDNPKAARVETEKRARRCVHA